MATAASMIKLLWLESLGALGGAYGVVSSVTLVAFFPVLSSLFAAAASVSRARYVSSQIKMIIYNDSEILNCVYWM